MTAFVRYPDPRLSATAEPRATVDDALREVGRRLVEAARDEKAYGLAAAHLGEVASVVVVGATGETGDHLVLYNPQVRGIAPETAKGEEASVSLPGIRVEIERPLWAEIDFMDATGARKSMKFEGFAARVALHEIEQTQGIFFLDKLSRLKRDMALKKARKHAG